MSRIKMGIISVMVLAAVMAAFYGVVGRNAAITVGLNMYMSAEEKTIVSGEQYSDEYINIYLAKTADKLVVAATLKGNDLEGVYYGPSFAGRGPNGSLPFEFEQLGFSWASQVTVSVYDGGFIVKRPARSYGFAVSDDIPSFETVEEATLYLKQLKGQ